MGRDQGPEAASGVFPGGLDLEVAPGNWNWNWRWSLELELELELLLELELEFELLLELEKRGGARSRTGRDLLERRRRLDSGPLARPRPSGGCRTISRRHD